MKHVSDPPLLP